MKKVISVILSVVLLLSVFQMSVSATADNGFEDYEQCIYDALINCEEKVDLTEYNVKPDTVSSFLNKIILCYPEISFNIAIISDGENSYYDFKPFVYSDTGNIAHVEIGYNMGKDEYRKAVKLVEDTVKPVLDKVKNFSDFEKALYIHDWLCVNFMYDYRLAEAPGTENHDIVGFFEDKMGVCQSYAYTYMYMLRQVGIESHYVISNTDNHGWNIVNIDGNWYHVDVTHDDPVVGSAYHYDYVGEVKHNKFLLSDSEIVADGNHDNFYIPMLSDAPPVCGEYTGNDSWRTAVSSVLKIDGYWYYLDNSGNAGGLMRTKDFVNTERIAEIGYYYESGDIYGWLIGTHFSGGYYTGLFEYNEHLFFTDEDDIYVYDTHHNVFNKLPVERPEGLYYFGLNMNGMTLTYLTSDSNIREHVVTGSYSLGVHLPTNWEIIKNASETEAGEKVKYCYFCGEIIERQSIPAIGTVRAGDADGNGIINTSDLATEKLYLAGAYSDIGAGADFNFDGKVDTSDLASLKLYLAGVLGQ